MTSELRSSTSLLFGGIEFDAFGRLLNGLASRTADLYMHAIPNSLSEVHYLAFPGREPQSHTTSPGLFFPFPATGLATSSIMLALP